MPPPKISTRLGTSFSSSAPVLSTTRGSLGMKGSYTAWLLAAMMAFLNAMTFLAPDFSCASGRSHGRCASSRRYCFRSRLNRLREGYRLIRRRSTGWNRARGNVCNSVRYTNKARAAGSSVTLQT